MPRLPRFFALLQKIFKIFLAPAFSFARSRRPSLPHPRAVRRQRPASRQKAWVILGHAEHDLGLWVILGYRLMVAQHDPCAMRRGDDGTTVWIPRHSDACAVWSCWVMPNWGRIPSRLLRLTILCLYCIYFLFLNQQQKDYPTIPNNPPEPRQ